MNRKKLSKVNDSDSQSKANRQKRKVGDALTDKITLTDLKSEKVTEKDVMASYLPSIEEYIESLGVKVQKMGYSGKTDYETYKILPREEISKELEEKLKKQLGDFVSNINTEIEGRVDVDKPGFVLQNEPIVVYVHNGWSGAEIQVRFTYPGIWYQRSKESTGNEKLD